MYYPSLAETSGIIKLLEAAVSRDIKDIKLSGLLTKDEKDKLVYNILEKVSELEQIIRVNNLFLLQRISPHIEEKEANGN